MGRPLEQYFHGDSTISSRLGRKGVEKMSVFHRNMFLAEDRILCFELVTKAGSKWHLGIVKGAKAETDVPEGMIDFITQRRRWLNGAFASTTYSLLHFGRVYRSSHNIVRLMLLHIQLVYNVVSLALSWFSLASFLLTLFILTDISGSPPADSKLRAFPFGRATPTINAIIQWIYLALIVLQFIMALGNRPRKQVWGYVISFFIFGFIQFYLIVNVIYLSTRIFKEKAYREDSGGYSHIGTFYSDIGSLTVIVAGVSLFGVYYVASFLHLDPWHMFISYPQFLFVSSSYTNILNVYAFSNWHDVSWGSKGGREVDMADLPPSVKACPRSGTAEIEDMSDLQTDIDSRFEEVVKRALTPHVRRPVEKRSQDSTIEDSFKAFRTKLVAVYIFSNFFLCIFIMNDSFEKLRFLVRIPSLLPFVSQQPMRRYKPIPPLSSPPCISVAC
jgi:chitin synthase